MQDILPRRGVQAGLAGVREAAVLLGDDADARLQGRILLRQEVAEDLHRAVLAAVVHEDELDVGIGLRE